MIHQTNITDEQLWAEVEAVLAHNRPAPDEVEWEALTREVSDEELATAASSQHTRHITLWMNAVAAVVLFAAFLALEPDKTTNVTIQPLQMEEGYSMPLQASANNAVGDRLLTLDEVWKGPLLSAEDVLANEDLLGIRGYYTDSRTIAFQRAMNLHRQSAPSSLSFNWKTDYVRAFKEYINFINLLYAPSLKGIEPQHDYRVFQQDETPLLSQPYEIRSQVYAYKTKALGQADNYQQAFIQPLRETERIVLEGNYNQQALCDSVTVQ